MQASIRYVCRKPHNACIIMISLMLANPPIRTCMLHGVAEARQEQAACTTHEREPRHPFGKRLGRPLQLPTQVPCIGEMRIASLIAMNRAVRYPLLRLE